MTATIVVAVAANGVIGRDNGLPWHLPDDLRHFKQLTLGRTLLMGRRTFESIGRPLPGRTTVVLTRDRSWSYDGVEVIHSLDDARALLRAPDLDVVLAGGGELYAALLPDIGRLEITEVASDVEGDTFFPALDPADWREVARDQRDGFAFVSCERVRDRAGERAGGGETDLPTLLRSLDPTADPTDLVFVTLPWGVDLPSGVVPMATVREDEGLTVVVDKSEADRYGWRYDLVRRKITLRVHSSLAAVGMTAAIASGLAARGIPTNMIAGAFHDHLYLPVGQVDEALSALSALADGR